MFVSRGAGEAQTAIFIKSFLHIIVQTTMKTVIPTEKYREGLSRDEAIVLSELSYSGRSIFSLEDLRDRVLNPSRFVGRLLRKNWLVRLKRGLYLVAPLEAGAAGSDAHTVHPFLIASNLASPYYIGYWSALNYHGLTSTVPPKVYVATTKALHERVILHRTYRMVFASRRKFFGLEDVSIGGEVVKLSDVEKTFVDCLDRPRHCGGMGEIATAFLAGVSLDHGKLLRYARRIGNRTVLKRLGFLAESLNIPEIEGAIKRSELSKGYSILDPTLPSVGGTNDRWGLRVNADPEDWFK